jgi:hypothetical protein
MTQGTRGGASRFAVLLCVIVVAAIMVGCGASTSSSSSGSSGFPSADSSAFAEELSSAAAGGMVSSTSAALSKEIRVHPDDITCNASGCIVDVPLDYTVNCTTGGSMHLSGDIDGSINSSGTGILQFQADIAILDWTCIEGYNIASSPEISITGNFSFINGAPATTQELVIGGGFNWGSSSADSCSINLTTNFNSDGSGDTSGTLCGNSINISFSPQQSDDKNTAHMNMVWR